VRCHWERLGVLGPVYKRVGEGLSDRAIANELNLTEVTVQGCISWMSHFLKCKKRVELVLYASPVPQETWSLRMA
jgi:DNA-binding NarL/FixJ family response regulator